MTLVYLLTASLLAFAAGGALLAKQALAERRLVAARLGALRPAPVAAARKPSERLKLRSLNWLVDPLLGINRQLASDERLPTLPYVVVAALVAAALFAVLTGLFGASAPLAAAASALGGVLAGRLAVNNKRDGIRNRMEDEFAAALGVIIRCVRVGLPVVEGMRAVAAEVPAPTGPEFRRCVEQIQLGEDFDQGLVRMADRCAMADYRFFAVAVSLQRQTGGNLAETLDNLAETIRKRRAVRLRAQSLTSEARATVAVLAILPVVVGVLLLFVNADYIMQLFTTDGGKMLLGIAAVTQGFGLAVIRSIVRRSLRA